MDAKNLDRICLASFEKTRSFDSPNTLLVLVMLNKLMLGAITNS